MIIELVRSVIVVFTEKMICRLKFTLLISVLTDS